MSTHTSDDLQEASAYLTLTDVCDRKWTRTMVRDLLGAPDRTRPNPHSRKAAPMRLYAIDRVEQAEATEAFQQRRAAAARRSTAARQAAEQQRDELLTEVERLTVSVPKLPWSQLVAEACGSYNDLAFSRRRDSYASPSSDPEFLHRIMVNYLRHECTRYDSYLAALWGRVGKGDAAGAVRAKVLDAIAEAYPDLWDECSAQERRRWEA